MSLESVRAFLALHAPDISIVELGGKPRMLTADEVTAITGHPVGGVCPFGLAAPLPIYCDISLKAFADVYPAAGSISSALRISPARMAELVGAEWVDVCG